MESSVLHWQLINDGNFIPLVGTDDPYKLLRTYFLQPEKTQKDVPEPEDTSRVLIVWSERRAKALRKAHGA